MKDLNRIYQQCLRELRSIGIPVRAAEVTVNPRLKSVRGKCTRGWDGTYSICVNSALLEDCNPDSTLKTTLLHELLHTCDGCLNHGARWQQYADRVSRDLGYQIKRTATDAERLNVNAKAECATAYHLKCLRCGADIVKYRMCESVRHPENFCCAKCGGTIVRR